KIRHAMPQLRKLAGKTSKWRQPLPGGSLLFAFATNFKTAGLLPHLPGEFILKITWSHGKNPPRKDYVSLFQYTTDSEAKEFASLQRAALEKFFRQPEKDALRQIYAYEPDRVPRANIEEYHFYFSAEDARAWGQWYATILPAWTARFTSSPESNEDWAWRV